MAPESPIEAAAATRALLAQRIAGVGGAEAAAKWSDATILSLLALVQAQKGEQQTFWLCRPVEAARAQT